MVCVTTRADILISDHDSGFRLVRTLLTEQHSDWTHRLEIFSAHVHCLFPQSYWQHLRLRQVKLSWLAFSKNGFAGVGCFCQVASCQNVMRIETVTTKIREEADRKRDTFLDSACFLWVTALSLKYCMLHQSRAVWSLSLLFWPLVSMLEVIVGPGSSDERKWWDAGQEHECAAFE